MYIYVLRISIIIFDIYNKMLFIIESVIHLNMLEKPLFLIFGKNKIHFFWLYKYIVFITI